MDRWSKFNDDYLISDSGIIKNINTGRISTGSNLRGYKALRKKGKKVNYIHRIVAIHFIPNPDNKPYVNHIDGNKVNNHYSNLEWVTHQQNITHAKNLPNFQSKKLNRFKEHETIEIIKMNYVYGLNFNEISKIYNRSKWSIRKVLSQKHHLSKAISL